MLYDLFTGGLSNFDIRSFLIQLLLSLPVFLLSLSFHEAAHAWMANRCGDPTARMLGRMTLNPVKHVDPIGFLMLLVIGLGYAKPVPVNPRNYRNPRRDDFFVSIAGICANLILFVAAVLMMFGFYFYIFETGNDLGAIPGYLFQMVQQLAVTNLVLACFNLLPVPPLDGYHVFNDLLFGRRLFAPEMAMRVGQALLLVLLFTGLLNRGLSFVINNVFNGIYWLMTRVFLALGVL